MWYIIYILWKYSLDNFCKQGHVLNIVQHHWILKIIHQICLYKILCCCDWFLFAVWLDVIQVWHYLRLSVTLCIFSLIAITTWSAHLFVYKHRLTTEVKNLRKEPCPFYSRHLFIITVVVAFQYLMYDIYCSHQRSTSLSSWPCNNKQETNDISLLNGQSVIRQCKLPAVFLLHLPTTISLHGSRVHTFR